jgi:hypothetical protein
MVPTTNQAVNDGRRSRKAYSSKHRFHHKQKSGLIPEAPKKTFQKHLLAGQNLQTNQTNQTNPDSIALPHCREPPPPRHGDRGAKGFNTR